MAGIAGAGDDRQVGHPAAHAPGEAHREHRIVHGEHQRLGVAEVQLVDQLGAGDVAEQHVVTAAPRRVDVVDIGIDADIGQVVAAQHVRHRAADPAEADDDGAILYFLERGIERLLHFRALDQLGDRASALASSGVAVRPIAVTVVRRRRCSG